MVYRHPQCEVCLAIWQLGCAPVITNTWLSQSDVYLPNTYLIQQSMVAKQTRSQANTGDGACRLKYPF